MNSSFIERDVLPPFGLNGWSAVDIADPYPVYRRYREAGTIHCGTDGTRYLLGYDDVERVLSSRNFGRRADAAGHSSSAGMVSPKYAALQRMVENWLVFLDPPRHTELRSVFAGKLSRGVVSGLRQRITDIASSLLSRCADASEFDLVEVFSGPLPILVISELMGASTDDWKWLRDKAIAIQSASSSRRYTPGVDALCSANGAAEELADYFLSLMRQRRRSPKADLVSLLASHSSLSDNEVASNCVHLMTAGHETTTNMLSKAILILGDNPEAMSLLRIAGGVPVPAVEELVRLDGPVQSVTRWAYRDVRLGSSEIRRGTKVVAVLGAANRDPARFDDPDVPRFDRQTGRDVGFGLGIHYCLGATLARTEIEIGLGLLLDTVGQFAVQKVDYPNDMVFHGPSSLVLRRV